nr:GIY-YIG catalytic domain-containing endonuclease [Kaumoebavirus]
MSDTEYDFDFDENTEFYDEFEDIDVEFGSIYLVTCSETDKVYVGQTKHPLDKRWTEHKRDARVQLRHQQNPGKYLYKSSCVYLYNAMNRYGHDNFEISLLQEGIPVGDPLNDAETEYVKEYNSLRPNGYNLTTGGGQFKHNEATLKKMSEKSKESWEETLEDRRNELLKGLPKHVWYIPPERNDGNHGFRVSGHPLCKNHNFTFKKIEDAEKIKEKVKEFIADLEASGEMYEPPKKNDESLPPGVIYLQKRDGYRVQKKHEGKLYKRDFVSKKLTDAEKRKLALDHYNDLMKKLNLDA